MSNSDLASLGRFSSQMLTYFGAQRTITTLSGQNTNTFKYQAGQPVFTEPGSAALSQLGAGVVGYASASAYDYTKSYFLSRGMSVMYAETMVALTLDISNSLGVTPQWLLEQSGILTSLSISDNAYTVFNTLRDPSHQVGTMTTVVNRDSLQARSILA